MKNPRKYELRANRWICNVAMNMALKAHCVKVMA